MKSVAGLASDRLTAAAFAPMVERLSVAQLPDYLIVSYDRMRESVILAEYIDGADITRERIVARAALGPTARRAGWIGSTIDLTGLTRYAIVGPSFRPEIERWAGSIK